MNDKSSLRVSSEAPSDTKYPVDVASPEDHVVGESELIYIDPEKEAACRAKFDKYVVPVSVIYLVLSTLDRNNVSRKPCSPAICHLLTKC
jgi:hypothetical protein